MKAIRFLRSLWTPVFLVMRKSGDSSTRSLLELIAETLRIYGFLAGDQALMMRGSAIAVT